MKFLIIKCHSFKTGKRQSNALQHNLFLTVSTCYSKSEHKVQQHWIISTYFHSTNCERHLVPLGIVDQSEAY